MHTDKKRWPLAILAVLLLMLMGADRFRIIVETDAGGDPDDEQSMVRFLLYSNEFDVEGIIANRPAAREGENKNSERTGLGIVRRMVTAYGECWPKLSANDRRYPSQEYLMRRTVGGYDEVEDGVRLVMETVERDDPRPVWFCNWGTDKLSGVSCLKRALDRLRAERGEEGYEKFKNKIRLSSDDQFGEHTWKIEPGFAIWVDTFRPEVEGKRWYHRFSAIVAKAGGFDITRDCIQGHGALGALYPLNTTHPQKEGDTMSFLYLVPTGMNDPERPDWGSWAGRYGKRDDAGARNYWWANAEDQWEGSRHRENSLKRWAEDLQNDFRARLEWCVKDYAHANHPPVARVMENHLVVRAGDEVKLDASGSFDPDGNELRYRWIFYPEASGWVGKWPEIVAERERVTSFVAPEVEEAKTLHVILAVRDEGTPALTRYQRVIIEVRPRN